MVFRLDIAAISARPSDVFSCARRIPRALNETGVAPCPELAMVGPEAETSRYLIVFVSYWRRKMEIISSRSPSAGRARTRPEQ